MHNLQSQPPETWGDLITQSQKLRIYSRVPVEAVLILYYGLLFETNFILYIHNFLVSMKLSCKWQSKHYLNWIWDAIQSGNWTWFMSLKYTCVNRKPHLAQQNSLEESVRVKCFVCVEKTILLPLTSYRSLCTIMYVTIGSNGSPCILVLAYITMTHCFSTVARRLLSLCRKLIQ